MPKRVVVTDHAFNTVKQEAAMALAHGAEFAEYACVTEQETSTAATGADVLFVNFARISRTVLEQLSSGATVIRYGIGYDNVDLDAAKDLGIAVANVPDYGIETVADHASASLLALGRRIKLFDNAIRERGRVAPADLGPIRSFRATTVGMVGMGKIAQAVVRRLRPFGFSFLTYDPYCSAELLKELGIRNVSLLELAERSHAISLHAPSTPETYRMIDGEFLGRVPFGTIIVNTARGSLIDEVALADAVRSGRLAGAALDVTDPEPTPADSPLRAYPEIMLSPHAAFYDEDSIVNLQRLASEEASRALGNKELRCRVA